MAQISRSAATLRIIGDDLIPSEISDLLNCEATSSQTKGEIITGKNTGKKRVAKTGMWRISTSDYEPENLDLQIFEILKKTTQDLEVWEKLSSKYNIDLFCGLFMTVGNEGMEISPASLKALGERGIHLSLDIYGEIRESPDQNDICPCNSGRKYGDCCYK